MNEKMKKNTLLASVIAILLIICCTFYLVSEKNKKSLRDKILIKQNISTGIIVKYTHGYKSIAKYEYRFQFNGKDYYSNSSSSSFVDNYVTIGNTVVNKSFPVIFNTEDPDLSKLLIVPDDFKEYNIPFPDSLNWVKEVLDK